MQALHQTKSKLASSAVWFLAVVVFVKILAQGYVGRGAVTLMYVQQPAY